MEQNNNEPRMSYKLIYEDETIEIWFEPITDEVDGFVIHNKDEEHSIVGIYTPSLYGTI